MDIFVFLDARQLHVIAVGVYRLMPQGENTLGHFIYFGQQVSVELFKLGMQLKEVVALHVPVVATHIHVKNLIVGQQVIEFLG